MVTTYSRSQPKFAIAFGVVRVARASSRGHRKAAALIRDFPALSRAQHRWRYHRGSANMRLQEHLKRAS